MKWSAARGNENRLGSRGERFCGSLFYKRSIAGLGLSAKVILSAMIKASICFKGLLALGANMNQRDIYGESAIYKACMSKSESCVRALYSAGCDINLRNGGGRTALE